MSPAPKTRTLLPIVRDCPRFVLPGTFHPDWYLTRKYLWGHSLVGDLFLVLGDGDDRHVLQAPAHIPIEQLIWKVSDLSQMHISDKYREIILDILFEQLIK